jgi:signal transduction histidine kinase
MDGPCQTPRVPDDADRYGQLERTLEEQRALRRVATLVAGQHEPEEVLMVVAEEVARHLEADAALLARYDSPRAVTVLADWCVENLEPVPAGATLELAGDSAMARVRAAGAPARVDSYAAMESEHAAEMHRLGMRAAVAAPILVDGRLWGVVAAGSAGAPFPADAEERLAAFAELVAQAIGNVDARMQLKESRVRIVQAADEARRRIERDLHDGAQQRLVSVALQLRLLAMRLGSEHAAQVQLLIDETQAALQDLRELAHGIHPAVLTEHGLAAALDGLAARSPVPVLVEADLAERLPAAQEAALYFVAAEALTNVAKYAQAGSAEVRVTRDDGWAQIAIADDGVGGARPGSGSGLRGLADRIDALDGELTVESPPGAGTTVRARVPA